jgi:outer membrane protein assembly factor BamB
MARPTVVEPAPTKGGFFLMGTTRKIVSTTFLFGVPYLLATGCAPGGGSALAPAVNASAFSPMRSQPAPAQAASWERAAAKTAVWLQFGYDAGHSADNPLEKTLGAKNVSKLQIGWNDTSIIQPTGIVVDKGTVYVADGSQSPGDMYALDATTGKQRWAANVALGNVNLLSVPAVSGSIVLSPCSTGSGTTFKSGLCGLNANSGHQQWATLCTPYQSNTCAGVFNHGTSASVYGGLAIFQMTNGINEQPDIDGVDPKTGKIVWDVGGSYLYHCPDAGGPINPLPAADGHVFGVIPCFTVGSKTGTYVCSISASSGALGWCTASQDAYVDRLVAGEGKVFASESAGSSGTSIVAMDEKTGAVAWKSPAVYHNVGAIAVANDRVFVNNYSTVYALSAKSGKILWTQTQGGIEAGGDLSVANGIVYTNAFGGNNGDIAITALNEKNGKLIWDSSSIAGNGSSEATPAVVNGTIYAACYTLCQFTLPSQHH